MGMELREKLLPLVKEKSGKYQLDFKLVDAIIQTESSYNIYAVRFEPKSTGLVIPSKYARINFTTEESELTLQKFSWGITQIMGSTARWLGYQGPMPFLCDVDTNLNWACRYLSKLKSEHGVNDQVIASYNAGSPRRKPSGDFVNQEYVDRVLKIYNS